MNTNSFNSNNVDFISLQQSSRHKRLFSGRYRFFFSVLGAVILVISSCTTTGPESIESKKKDKTIKEAGAVTEEAEEPLPEPEIRSVSVRNGKDSAKTGELVVIDVDALHEESVSFDFEGNGEYSSENRFRFSAFGIKTVGIRDANRDHTVTESFSFPVVGTADVTLDKNEIQHSTNENEALIHAEINARGTYDTVNVSYDQQLVLEIEKRNEYHISIPFVGKYTFLVELYEQGEKVADCNAITVTGLNEPPVLNNEFSKLIKGNAGEEVTFDLSESVTDPNEDQLHITVQGAPEGAAFDERTGVFRWTPQRAGLYLIDFYVSDYPYKTGNVWLQRMLAIE